MQIRPYLGGHRWEHVRGRHILGAAKYFNEINLKNIIIKKKNHILFNIFEFVF